MDSINRNQEEETRENLNAAGAAAKITEMVEKAETCFFCTAVSKGESGGVRPMNVLKTWKDGTLWFLSASDSHKNAEIAEDPDVTLYFQGSLYSDFLVLRGKASISTDKEKIRELWSKPLQTWFTEGVEDPRITVIEVKPVSGYYWDTKHGNAVAGIKVMIGSLLGKTMDDSIEGTISV